MTPMTTSARAELVVGDEDDAAGVFGVVCRVAVVRPAGSSWASTGPVPGVWMSVSCPSLSRSRWMSVPATNTAIPSCKSARVTSAAGSGQRRRSSCACVGDLERGWCLDDEVVALQSCALDLLGVERERTDDAAVRGSDVHGAVLVVDQDPSRVD